LTELQGMPLAAIRLATFRPNERIHTMPGEWTIGRTGPGHARRCRSNYQE